MGTAIVDAIETVFAAPVAVALSKISTVTLLCFQYQQQPNY